MLVNLVRQYLATQHMYVDDDWITGCVEYLTEDSSNNCTETDIKNLAREQWLLNDLKDICPGSLPANLKTLRKTTLTGTFVLQVNAAVDIGTPAYQQYLKLQKVNMENVEATMNFEDKISNHRMIKLYLTDGAQEITAIEYKPMRNLSCDITPGCKIMIKGPVECRRGMLFLTEGVIELLGGEVQELALSNSLAGLITTKLGLPLVQDADPNTTLSHPRNTNIPTPHTAVPPPAAPSPPPARPVARVTGVPVATINDDDDIDIDQIAAIEAQVTENPTKRSLNESSSTNPVKKLKTEPKQSRVLSEIRPTTTNFYSNQTHLTTSTKFHSNQTNLTTSAEFSSNQMHPITSTNVCDIKNSSDYPDDDDLIMEEDEDCLRELEQQMDARDNQICANTNRGPVAVSSEPFVYIRQINEMTSREKAGRVFNIKGQIMKLLSKLSIGKDGWSLKCTIVDGTGTIDVEFTSDVLSKLVGLTPQEMKQLKKDIAKNPDMNKNAVGALQKAKETLQVLYCIIELTILEVPKITCLTPYDQRHVDALKRRLASASL